MRRIVLLAFVVLAIAVPARATSNVTVSLALSAGRPAPTGALCAVVVASGSDGVTVLEAAKRKGCIESYTLQTHSFGRLVHCINRVCGAPAEALFLTYWAMSVNGEWTDYGVDDFRAANGSQLGFAYTTWATCLTPVGC